MSLDPTVRADLARFLARRFPAPSDRAELARRAGVSDVEAPDAATAWTTLVERADATNRLAALVAAAAERAPNDRNLAEARRLVRAASPSRKPLAVAGLVVIAGGLAWGVLHPTGTPPPAPTVKTSPTPAPVEPAPGAASPVAPVPPQVTVRTPVPAGETPKTAEIEAAGPPTVPPAAAPAAAELPAAEPDPGVPARCRAPVGQLVGWWWAGDKPGDVGDTLTLDVSANVRADYPRPENGYRMSRPILCTLPPGTHQRLSRAPQDSGKGHDWWVPVVGGDFVR